MNFDNLNFNNKGIVSIEFSSGETLNINSHDPFNNNLLQHSIYDRISHISPAIEYFGGQYGKIINLTPLEEAEFNYLKLRVSNLENERNMLLGFVNQLKDSPSEKETHNNNLDTLSLTKIKWKSFIGDNKINSLKKEVDNIVIKDSEIYNDFIVVFSKYAKNEGDNKLGFIPRPDYSMIHSQIVMSLSATIDKMTIEDIEYRD